MSTTISDLGPDLSFERVAAWVKDMPNDEVCGRSATTSSCPLAQLALQQGVYATRVEPEAIAYWIDGPLDFHEYPTTRFQEHFIAAVDEGDEGEYITAADVRRIPADLAPTFGPQEAAS